MTRAPERRRWSVDEYHRLGEQGYFLGERVELLHGEIVTLSPLGPLHAQADGLMLQALLAVFAAGYWVRVQHPLQIGNSEPQPDFAVVAGSPRSVTQHPTTALLVVEISDTSLDYDRQVKGPLYASAGIADYWLVNLVARQVEVYRAPQPVTSSATGFVYAQRRVMDVQGDLVPLAQPGARILVADVLP